jgi:hypothetical protein
MKGPKTVTTKRITIFLTQTKEMSSSVLSLSQKDTVPTFEVSINNSLNHLTG